MDRYLRGPASQTFVSARHYKTGMHEIPSNLASSSAVKGSDFGGSSFGGSLGSKFLGSATCPVEDIADGCEGVKLRSKMIQAVQGVRLIYDDAMKSVGLA